MLTISDATFSTIGEKLWIRQWGIAYESYEHSSLASTYLSTDDSILHTEPRMVIGLPKVKKNLVTTTALPSPYTYPMIYVLIYGGITLSGACITTINTVIQYYGAFTASRLTRNSNSCYSAEFPSLGGCSTNSSSPPFGLRCDGKASLSTQTF